MGGHKKFDYINPSLSNAFLRLGKLKAQEVGSGSDAAAARVPVYGYDATSGALSSGRNAAVAGIVFGFSDVGQPTMHPRRQQLSR